MKYGVIITKPTSNHCLFYKKELLESVGILITNATQNLCFINSDQLNVFDIIDLNSLVFMYKAFHNLLPTHLLSYFKKVNDSHNHNTRNNTLSFKVGLRRTSKKALSICIKGSKMWNALSPDIKLSSNANAFKKMLKSSLLEDYKFL